MQATPLTTETAETQLLRETYAALNRGDIPALMRVFAPDIERTEPAHLPGGGVYRGLAAVEAHFAKSRAKWAEGSCEIERFVVAGDKIIAFIHVRVRLKDETQFREGHIADAFTFRAGKAVYFRTFVDTNEALAWAGTKVPAPT